MKLFFIILIIFSSVSLKAQQQVKNVNFALLNFDLTDTKLSFEDQELFLSALLSLGDKEIVLEEIFQRLLKSQDFTIQDSILQSYLNEFTLKDKKAIDKYPRLVEDWREIIFHSVNIVYMGQAYLDSITLSEAYLNIHQNAPKYFPNIPKESVEDEHTVLTFIKKYLDFTKWAINFPEEYQYFDDLLKEQTQRFFHKQKEKNIIEFANHVKENAIKTNSVAEQNIPTSINTSLAFYQNQKVRNLKYIEKCNPSEIDIFISEAYKVIYRSDIPNNKLIKLTKHIRENKLYDPELIYLAILLSKYE